MSDCSDLLIVDDEPAVAEFVTEVAEAMGFSVNVVNDGASFLETYEKLDPTVIFLDLKLPGLDGIELLRYLGEQQCTATVFIVSGSDPRTLAAASTVGKQHRLKMGNALSKPLTIEDVEAALQSLTRSVSAVTGEDVRQALANDEFRVHFQPKVDLLEHKSTRPTGVEALARWAIPGGGWVFPDKFIPVIREAGLMRQLTDLVVEKSLIAARTWLDKGLDLSVSINLDGVVLDDRTLPDALAKATERHNVPPSRLTLEITESAAMSAPAATMDILTRFRLKDFNVSLDDFGTGYSSLVQLYRLPFNELKIDKSFVMDIGVNGEAEIIVETLVMLGHKLGLVVCAEGIENARVLSFVRKCGCDLGQGYLFSKPVEPEMIEALTQQWVHGKEDGAMSFEQAKSGGAG